MQQVCGDIRATGSAQSVDAAFRQKRRKLADVSGVRIRGAGGELLCGAQIFVERRIAGGVLFHFLPSFLWVTDVAAGDLALSSVIARF
jgi:hypothetical protein